MTEGVDGLEQSQRSRRRWRVTAIVLVVALPLMVALLGYALLNTGVTLMYQETEVDRLERTRAQLQSLALRISPRTTKAELLALLKEIDPEDEPFEKEGGLHTGWVSFYFDASDHLVRVESDLDKR
jgi:hypothetical protein